MLLFACRHFITDSKLQPYIVYYLLHSMIANADYSLLTKLNVREATGGKVHGWLALVKGVLMSCDIEYPKALDEAGVIRATVETVAENASDGEVAPLFYLLLFGVTGGWVYKAVNTMDSMLGYKNARYELFGRVAARMDDVFNWIPARIAALLLIAAAAITGQDAREASRIFRRDRYRHASPNSAQTESVMAGALGVRLAGPASYFGERKEKPYIGDAGREIETEDIARANRMLTAASWLSLFFFLALRLFCRAIAAKLTLSLQSAAVLLPLLF